MSNVVTAVFHEKTRSYRTRPLHQYDYGQQLQIQAPGLPEVFEVHFSNGVMDVNTVEIGNAGLVPIPDVYLVSGKPVYAWLFTQSETSGETRLDIIIPVIAKGQTVGRSGTPAQETAIARAINALNAATKARQRVHSLDATALAANTIVEAVGVPVYVSDVADYADYGLTAAGWYVFARIDAPDGVDASAAVAEGVAGQIRGSGSLDIAVRFEVAAMSQLVTITWDADNVDTFVFKATDLATRNLDYRTTFYVYDISPFVTWEYAFTADTTFKEGKKYYTKGTNDVYTLAEVEPYSYALTADATFQEGKTYYTKDGDTYTAATVTAGEAVTADTYYERSAVPVPAYYVQTRPYALTTDTTFTEGKTYYNKDGDTYTPATVTAGEAIPADTYYEHTTAYVQTTDVTFHDGVTYYTKSGSEYVEATVTIGDPIPAYYNHSKVTFSGMARNITYMLDEVVDCPQVYVLPEIEDDTHGCWYEIRLRHSGAFSSTLQVPEGVKVATEHTQAETAGLNMVDLHYTNIDGVKLWRFLNTHSTIPA